MRAGLRNSAMRIKLSLCFVAYIFKWDRVFVKIIVVGVGILYIL